MPKPQRFCTFRGGSGLSDEHLFALWLKEIFPRTAHDTHTYGELAHNPQTWTAHTRQGHSGSRKIRTVCKKCNNEWVGAIDDAAKYVATSIIYGERTSITPAMQIVLARWFTKIAMVGNSQKCVGSKVAKEHREWFKEHKLPPAGWEVYIGYYTGTVWRDLGIFQSGGDLDFTPITSPRKATGYGNTTFMGMGNLCALVIGWGVEGVNPQIHGPGALKLFRIWPTQSDIAWPTIAPLDDREATAIAHIIQTLKANITGTP